MVRKNTKETQKPYKQNSKQPKKSYLPILFSSLVSAAFTIVISLSLVVPALHREFSAQQALLAGRQVQVEPVSNMAVAPNPIGVCVAPSESASNGARPLVAKSPIQVAATKPATNGDGGGNNSNNIVEKFMAENKTSNQATIRDTGAGSTNTIAQVTKNITTVDNTNTVSVAVNNPQVAKSGGVDATTKDTTSGTSSSGSAVNSSDISFIFAIKQP